MSFELSYITFPVTVTLSIVSNRECSGYADSILIEGSVSSSYVYFNIEDWNFGLFKNIDYSSEDGIVYTISGGEPITVSFGDTPISFDVFRWNAVCGYFMKTIRYYYSSLYNCISSLLPDTYIIKNNQYHNIIYQI